VNERSGSLSFPAAASVRLRFFVSIPFPVPRGSWFEHPCILGLGKKFIFKHLSAYTLAFLALLIPWLISGVNPQGTPWILVKLFDVIHMRYENINPSAQRYMVSGLPGIGCWP